jgi:site-specific recombinase XerD
MTATLALAADLPLDRYTDSERSSGFLTSPVFVFFLSARAGVCAGERPSSDLANRSGVARCEFSTQAVCKSWILACDQAQVPRFNPYKLRHSFATLLRREGADLADVQH